MVEYYDHLCKCGCGGKIEIRKFHKRGIVPIYINHHNAISKFSKEEIKSKRLTYLNKWQRENKDKRHVYEKKWGEKKLKSLGYKYIICACGCNEKIYLKYYHMGKLKSLRFKPNHHSKLTISGKDSPAWKGGLKESSKRALAKKWFRRHTGISERYCPTNIVEMRVNFDELKRKLKKEKENETT